MRRARAFGPMTPRNVFHFRHVTVDADAHEVWVGSDILSLTTTEFSLLLELARHAGRVLTREQLIDRVWGVDFYGNDRVVDVYVGQVRRKLEQATGETRVEVSALAHEKCERCWHVRADVNADPDHPGLCGRCVENLYGEGEKREHA